MRVNAATGAAHWAERPEFSDYNTSRGAAISASGSLYTLGASGRMGSILLTRVPGAPDPLLLASTRNVPYTSRLVRLETMLAIIGFQTGPFSVGTVNMDPGTTDGERTGFILLVAP